MSAGSGDKDQFRACNCDLRSILSLNKPSRLYFTINWRVWRRRRKKLLHDDWNTECNNQTNNEVEVPRKRILYRLWSKWALLHWTLHIIGLHMNIEQQSSWRRVDSHSFIATAAHTASAAVFWIDTGMVFSCVTHSVCPWRRKESYLAMLHLTLHPFWEPCASLRTRSK